MVRKAEWVILRVFPNRPNARPAPCIKYASLAGSDGGTSERGILQRILVIHWPMHMLCDVSKAFLLHMVRLQYLITGLQGFYLYKPSLAQVEHCPTKMGNLLKLLTWRTDM